MYPIPQTETLAETKTCKHCGEGFPITDQDLEFYDKVSPVFAGKKYVIPAPTLCPDCRQQRRLSFRNERKLYKRKCDATGRDIISIYSPDKPFKVYHQDEWWSDKWDPLDYGRDFDFNRPFFEQFAELAQTVPQLALLAKLNENCEYVSSVGNSKNCYLIFDSDFCENCSYGKNLKHCQNVMDGLFVTRCENSYAVVDCANSYGLRFAWGCNESSESSYVVDLDNAHHCFLSHTVYNKSYVFENEACSKEEYANRVAQFFSLSPSEREERIRKWKLSYERDKVYPCHLSISFEDSVGSGLSNVKRVHASYDMVDCEDCKYCTSLISSDHCHDVDSYGWDLHLAYDSTGVWFHVSSVSFSDIVTSDSGRLSYCQLMIASSDCFGSVGLRNKQYCVFNKQYSKEEYETLVPKIIEHMKKTGEWGEFFPSSISPFGYNETVAQEYFPITREETLAKGFIWSDYEPPFPKVEKTIPAAKLPENIDDVPDDILNWAIECEVTKKPFRIIKQELEFYRKHNLPIPRRHPDQRHLDRMALRNPRKLFERTCDCPDCAKNHAAPDGKPAKFLTTYAPDRSEKVYCEKCYAKEIAG